MATMRERRMSAAESKVSQAVEFLDSLYEVELLDKLVIGFMAAKAEIPQMTIADVRRALHVTGAHRFESDQALMSYYENAKARTSQR